MREYVVFHGAPEPGNGVIAAKAPFAFKSEFVRNRFLRVFGRSLVYQPVFFRIAFGGFDALVIGHEIKYFMNVVLLYWFRAMGKPVLFWGFGTGQDFHDQDRGPLGRAVTRLINAAKRFLVRSASGYLAYTDSGVATVERAGMKRNRICVLNNTIDLDAEIAAHAAAQTLDRIAVRRQWGIAPDAVVFTFVGRLLSGKRVEDLIRGVAALRAAGIDADAIIVGDGPERQTLEDEADGAPWCHFLGAVHDVGGISRIYRASNALVIPGYVGLAVNRGFAHGMPIITMESSSAQSRDRLCRERGQRANSGAGHGIPRRAAPLRDRRGFARTPGARRLGDPRQTRSRQNGRRLRRRRFRGARAYPRRRVAYGTTGLRFSITGR